MDQSLIYTLLVIIGLIMGSYSGALVWRLRARQLIEDKKAGEKVDKKEYDKLVPLRKNTGFQDRSRCLHCGHELAWYDLLPLISWTSTRGKCRYCHKPIGTFEPLMELSMAAFFVVSYAFWPTTLHDPFEVVHFLLWLVASILLVTLFAYDMKWYLLPNRIVFPFIAIAGVVALLGVISKHDISSALLSLCLSVAILSGLYFVLWIASKGAWVGFGDVKLGLGLALLLGQWQLAFLALFAANLIGCLIVLPGMFTGKVKRSSRIPFGPLLILGTILTMLWGPSLIQWYFMTFA